MKKLKNYCPCYSLNIMLKFLCKGFDPKCWSMGIRPNWRGECCEDSISGVNYYCHQWNEFCCNAVPSGFLSHSFVLLISATAFARMLDSSSGFEYF